MKYYRILFLAAALTGLASCAVDPLKEYEVEKPQSIEQYEYLNEYDVLKNYVDRTASPDFRLGAALAASDFTAKTQVYSLAVSNFDEMTAGNAMKYSSVVGDDGSMNFVNVKNFVNTAEAAGMTVYGHTLAWHSQQNNKYLNSVIADKEIENEEGATETVVDAEFDYSTFTGWYYWKPDVIPNNGTIGIVDGVFQSHLPETTPNFWDFQYHVADGITWVAGRAYDITMMIRASEDCTITLTAGKWEGGQDASQLNITTEWTEVTVKRTPPADGSGFVMFQSGNFAGTIEMQWLKVSHEEAKVATIPVTVLEANFDDGTSPFGGWGLQSSRTVEDGVLKISNPVAGQNWEAQMAWDAPAAFNANVKYGLKYKIKGSAKGSFAAGFQIVDGYQSAGDFASVSFGTEWKEVDATCICGAEGATRLIFSFGAFTGDIYIDDLVFYYEKSANTIAQTPEEKKANLTVAMDNWIKGMMEATAGKVTAWDAVNEPVSGEDADGDGFYELWSAENGDPKNNFYWQDYLGDEDYVRLVVAKAREYYAEFGGTEPLKLFINDYNLESDWDDNKKLKSLIHWIEVWESDNVTKIDGIATQMHVSCYENPQKQDSQKAHVVEMFKLMAKTGKLVKISELDMGYIDANGKTVPTTSMTEEQHKAMAEYYKFIVSEYFKNVPAAQQYGITQWCLTDASGELGTGWRGGEPVGLWDLNYNRKHTYAGFAAGLQGE